MGYDNEKKRPKSTHAQIGIWITLVVIASLMAAEIVLQILHVV